MTGLRERKKAATRQVISDVATRLFERRGFEQVTLAEIADAAGISVKTIFNYFGSKEELFFDREDELLEGLLRHVRERAPGVTATAAVRPLLLAGPVLDTRGRWADTTGELYEGLRAFAACEDASPTLSARRLLILKSWAAPLGRAAGSPAWAAMLVGILGLRQEVVTTGLLERRSARTIQRRVRATVGDALDALDRAFPNHFEP